jgi:hypothetical protein
MKPGSEAAFQQQVLNLATLYDWATYHPPDNRPSGRTGRVQRVVAGFPDLTLVRDEALLFAELKKENGRVSPAQTRWLTLLAKVPGVETYIWRPSDWDEIQARLSRGRHRLERAA